MNKVTNLKLNQTDVPGVAKFTHTHIRMKSETVQ